MDALVYVAAAVLIAVGVAGGVFITLIVLAAKAFWRWLVA